MDARFQLGEFAVCALLGLAFAGVIDIVCMQSPKGGAKKILSIVIEATAFVVFAAVCVWLWTSLGFTGRRGYHYLGILLGMILYLKTFRIIVAFFKKVCYNILKKVVKKRNKTKKTLKKEEK